ncbi:MAG: RNA polymerase sigma factor [Solirubrobacterales bacterium]
MTTRGNGVPEAADERIAAALLRGSWQGDPEAFLQLYDRYGSELYAYLYLVLTSAVDAEQATYDVLETAIDRFRRYELGPVPFRVWLFWLAHDRVGASRSRRRPPEDGDPLASLITRLPVGGREALVLLRVLGFSLAEVSLILRRAPGRVGVLEARALESLGEMLAVRDGAEREDPAPERAGASERLSLRLRSRESPVSYRRRWALALR